MPLRFVSVASGRNGQGPDRLRLPMTTTGQTESRRYKASSEPRVAIIVLTWNGKALTLGCLASLSLLRYDDLLIVVVDNGSADGTSDAIREIYEDQVHVIVNGENLGFSRGNNLGIRYALDHGARHVLLLNNDTVVDPNLIRHLVDAMQRGPDIGIVGPKIYYEEPPNQIWSAGGEVFLARGTARHIGIREIDRGQYESPRDVDYVSGCALMARREVFEAIGDLDPAFQAYFEDTDFCMRARRSGFRIVYVPAGVVWHKISSSTGGQMSAKKISRKLRSSVIFFRRYASFNHWLTIPFFFAADVVRILALVLSGRIRNAPGVDDAAPGNRGRT
jgi:GT2 family glycosyltransferase